MKITLKTALSNSLISTIIFSVYGFYNYSKQTEAANEDINFKVEQIASSAHNLAANSLWEFNQEGAETGLKSFFADKYLSSMEIIDLKDNSSFTKVTSESKPKNVKKIEKKVHYEIDGEKEALGLLKIEYSLEKISEIRKSVIAETIFTSLILVLITSLFITWYIYKAMIKRINSVSTASERVRQQDFAKISVKNSQDEIFSLEDNFNNMVESIEKGLKESQEKAALKAEMETASIVQQTLIPSDVHTDRYEVTGYYRSAENTGGDWYGHYLDEKDDVLYIYCGDVTGHGIPSALVTGVIAGSSIALQEYGSSVGHGEMSMGENLACIASSFNKAVFETGRKAGRLMTMFLCAVELKTGKCTFVNAGHNPPIWVKTKENKAKSLMGLGARLGFEKGSQFESKEFTLEEDDQLLFYTDGFVENTGPKGEVLSFKELKNLSLHHETTEETIESILKEAEKIWKGFKAEDDLSMLAFRLKKKECRAHRPPLDKKVA